MNITLIVLTALLTATMLCAVYLISYASKRRSMPGAKPFILLMITAIMYSGAYVGEVCSGDLASAKFWFYLEHIPIPIQHYLWMVMSLEYCRVSSKSLRIAKYFGLYHPIAYLLIFFTNHLHHLYIGSYSYQSNGYFHVIVSTKGPLFALMIASGTLIGIITTAFYIRGLVKSSSIHRYGFAIMMIASVFPWIAVYLGAANQNYLGIDYFPVVSVISGILYLLGIFKFNMFNVIPLATEIVFRQSKEGIMIVDLAGNIVDANDAMGRLYPELTGLSSKYFLNAFVLKHPELHKLSEGDTSFQYQLECQGSERHYSVQVTPIVMEDGVKAGKIVTLSDISVYVENQRMLESVATDAIQKAETNEVSFLQAQIKPHFINNILSVIGSMITRDPRGARELIGNLGEYLANCCYFDSSSPFVQLEQELETINTYVTIEKARFGERLNYHVFGEKVPNIPIPRLILQPLIENAIRHGILKKAEGGSVWLSIALEETALSFEIRDDGVGMSDEKLAEIWGEERANHGIGISNIHRRLVKYYGAGLQIFSVKGQGTTVAFTIPLENQHFV